MKAAALGGAGDIERVFPDAKVTRNINNCIQGQQHWRFPLTAALSTSKLFVLSSCHRSPIEKRLYRENKH